MNVVLYDGDCGLCSGLVRFILKRDRAGRFRFASLQGAVGRQLLRTHGVSARGDTFYVVRDEAPAVLERAQAALYVARALGLPWSLAGCARILPRRLLDGLYDVVARNRHRIAGPIVCNIASSERDRFLD